MSAPFLYPRFTVRLALVVTSLAAGVCIWTALCEFPIHAWNEMRLAPAFALRHGVNPYPPLGGGPLSTWIYGPVGILINLPATLATTPAGALHLASLINLLVVTLPLAVIFLSAPELRTRGDALPWLALTLGIMLIPRLNFALQVADHSSIALGLLSCWCLARRPQPGPARLATAAALCALAIWAKQIAVFLVAAQFVFLMLDGKRTQAGQYFAAVVFFAIITFAAAIWAFGFNNLWLNLVAIPARLPWADIPDRLAMRTWALLAEVVFPSSGLIWLWYWKRWPTRASESGRFFQLTVLVYSAMLPVGLAAFVKIGGDTNLLHSWDYLLPACLLVWLATDRISPSTSVRLVVITVLVIALRWTELVSPPIRPYNEHFVSASLLTAAHPNAIWFPRNPIITFYTGRQLWHSEDGMLTRFLAGYGLREPDFRRHLPPDLQAVAYPSNNDHHFAMPLLAEFDAAIQVPYWTLYTRPTQPSIIP